MELTDFLRRNFAGVMLGTVSSCLGPEKIFLEYKSKNEQANAENTERVATQCT
jgi:hypothetical protein